jgi:hypothetical protein
MIFNYFTIFYGMLIIASIWNKAGTTENFKKNSNAPLAPVRGSNRC